MAADNEVEAMLVGIREKCLGWGITLDDLVLDVDAGTVGTVLHRTEGVLEMTVGAIGRLQAVGFGLGVGWGVSNGNGHELASIVTCDIDGDIERTEGDVGSVPGKHNSLKHQCRMGMRARARMSAINMYNR